MDLDAVQNGILITASASPGFQITNLTVSALGGSASGAAVRVNAGGSIPPDLLVNGGSVVGTWGLGAFPTPPVGHLTVVNIVGFNLP